MPLGLVLSVLGFFLFFFISMSGCPGLDVAVNAGSQGIANNKHGPQLLQLHPLAYCPLNEGSYDTCGAAYQCRQLLSSSSSCTHCCTTPSPLHSASASAAGTCTCGPWCWSPAGWYAEPGPQIPISAPLRTARAAVISALPSGPIGSTPCCSHPSQSQGMKCVSVWKCVSKYMFRFILLHVGVVRLLPSAKSQQGFLLLCPVLKAQGSKCPSQHTT